MWLRQCVNVNAYSIFFFFFHFYVRILHLDLWRYSKPTQAIALLHWCIVCLFVLSKEQISIRKTYELHVLKRDFWLRIQESIANAVFTNQKIKRNHKKTTNSLFLVTSELYMCNKVCISANPIVIPSLFSLSDNTAVNQSHLGVMVGLRLQTSCQFITGPHREANLHLLSPTANLVLPISLMRLSFSRVPGEPAQPEGHATQFTRTN